jgi:hypothetical protein
MDSPLIRHQPHRERPLQFSYRCVCILYSGNVFTEPLPSNAKEDVQKGTRIDGRDIGSKPLRWTQVPWYTSFYVSWY